MGEEQKPLSERKKLILNAIVDAHISGGEPIGSKYLTQNKHIGYSSATIRNEMAELEDMGYLEQPHTSAGRVPTEAGYRFYVDSLVDRYNFTSQEIERLENTLTARRNELGDILAAGMRVASPEIEQTLKEESEAPTLTPRQLEILRSLARGLTNDDIAHEFGLSKAGVKFHLLTIFRKLNVANRTEAVGFASRKHLFTT